MRNPLRSRPKHPWGKESVLSGYVPGLSEKLDMFALIVSLSQSQEQLADQLIRLLKLVRHLAVLWAVCGGLWIASAFNLWRHLP